MLAMLQTAGWWSGTLARLDARAVADILLIAVVIYYVLSLLRGTRAAQMLVAVGFVFVLYYAAQRARLEMTEWLITNLLPFAAIAMIILFQPEIRAGLARAGRNPFWQRFAGRESLDAHDDIVLAVRHFSQKRIGALIVLEREVGLKIYVESGIPLDATLSYDLLLSIFHPQSPLHDGAAIVQKGRIAAAACFLPLSLNPALSTQMGTRHRAAIGVTEESDAMVVIVSEETGAISLCFGGSIEMNLTPEQLAERLSDTSARYRAAVGAPLSESASADAVEE
jgi:diadenylate cyclase